MPNIGRGSPGDIGRKSPSGIQGWILDRFSKDKVLHKLKHFVLNYFLLRLHTYTQCQLSAGNDFRAKLGSMR